MYEYLHRMLGRFIGIIFLLPFMFLCITRRIPKGLSPKLFAILMLGAFDLFFLSKTMHKAMRRAATVRDPMASDTRNQQGQPSSDTTRARTAWRTSGLLWYDLQASALETDVFTPKNYGATISLRRRLPLGAKCAPTWPRRSPRRSCWTNNSWRR